MALNVYNDKMVFDYILRSNIPKQEKSTIRRWFDSVTGGKASQMIEKYGLDEQDGKRVTFGEVVVAGSEAITVGGALGAMHAMLETGLDVKIPLTEKSVPVDGVLSGMSYLSAIMAPSRLGEHLKTVGTSAAAVYGFRKFHDMLSAKRSISKMGGEQTTSDVPDAEEPAPSDIGEDPIVTLANKLDG